MLNIVLGRVIINTFTTSQTQCERWNLTFSVLSFQNLFYDRDSKILTKKKKKVLANVNTQKKDSPKQTNYRHQEETTL